VDGYFRSGDLVRLTADGNMIVEGRIKDVVNRGGEKVSAEEIEDHLLAHPGIRNAAVVAMAHAAMGEKTCAFVVPRAGPLERHTLNAFLRERGLADYKLIGRLDLVDALPSTAVGKVNKAELRRMTAGSPGVVTFRGEEEMWCSAPQKLLTSAGPHLCVPATVSTHLSWDYDAAPRSRMLGLR
jgi:2,3-dihydroxybenzoate-AMP ligase